VVAVGALIAVTAFVASAVAPVGRALAVPDSGSSRALVRTAGSTPIPRGAHALGTLDPRTPLRADVVLRPRDPVALEAFDTAVSTPGSPSFRHYLAPGSFATVFGPTAATIAATRQWLEGQGVTVGPTAPDGLVIPVTGSADRMGRAFGVAIERFRLPSGREAHAPTASPLVPASLAPDLSGVVGLDDLSQPVPELVRARDRTSPPGQPAPRVGGPAPRSSGPTATSGCRGTIDSTSGGSTALTADQLAQAYSFSSIYGNPSNNEGQGVTVGIYELEPFLQSDITTFENCYSPAITASFMSVTVGSSQSGTGAGEAALDIETLIGLAPQVNVKVYVGNNSGSGPLDTYVQMVNDHSLKVISTSWGQCEAQTGSAVIQAESTLFQQAVAQGQTITTAAGDEGSADCFVFPFSSDLRLAVDDPASQPWVTTVGGTSVQTLGPPPNESVWNTGLFVGSGGGGISSYWTMPAWQRGPGVQNPFTKVRNSFTGAAPCPVSAGPGTVSCRQVPDVAAEGDPASGYAVYVAGEWQKIGGTSLGSPMWAAVAALADGANPSSPVGFMNPALYQLQCASGPSAFNDITRGNNQPIGSSPSNPPRSPGGPYYPATPNYDLASGLGSPIASALVTGLQSPPNACPVVTGMSVTSGPASGATTVALSGSNLSGVSEVDFGSGNPAAIVSTSGSTVTVTAPASPTRGWANVRVTVRAASNDVLGLDGSLPYTYVGRTGYWTVASDGGIFAFGQMGFYGSMGGIRLNQPVVAMTSTASSQGYWMVATDGGIFAFGDAQFFGSMGGTRLNQPVVGMAATADGRGYWLVATDGGIFAFGDAAFYGSMGAVHLNKPVVGMAPTPDGGGYWLVASDGGIFAFGDAAFYGSMGAVRLNKPVVGMATTPDGGGYWMVATDGGIFAFGDAGFHGSMGGTPLNQPVVGMAPTFDGRGYWLVASDGGIFAFGGRYGGFFGSMGATRLNQPMVGIGAP
jgi:hypothetical protein